MPTTGPYYDSSIAKLLREFQTQHPEVTDHQIAEALGYDRGNIVGMFRTGQTRLPIDKAVQLAQALNVDPVAITRLAFEQWGLRRNDVVGRLFDQMATANEQALLGAYRNAVGGSDFALPPEILENIRSLIAAAYRQSTGTVVS